MKRTPALIWAQQRNWLKARVIGGFPHSESETFTEEEKIIARHITHLRWELLEKWDANNAISKDSFLRRRKGGDA